ncbi:DUF4394 domain-containing protein [Pararhizobium sp.]|uniref:DUF4394 domain-containing protein n=1 Tax=Pararhizobium sp. TaxID=1977563 RepID=UPI00271C674D|nr:DUF4394 domain-containing protein [Pararhizobium sp.]MDO9417516.1 DUF4394 domain-containing protein [Pararhizobium sp.]
MTRPKTALAAAAFLAATAPAVASPAIGLIGDKTLVIFDTETPDISKRVDADGVDKLVGIDWNCKSGLIEGVTPEGGIVSLDTKTGKAKKIAQMDQTIPTGETPVVIDINPATQAIRFMTGSTNQRTDPETGSVTIDSQLAYVSSDPNAATLPTIVAAAYTNSHGTPKTTALYGIDAMAGVLVHQTMPNDGTLKTVGKLGVEPSDSYAFDIETTENGDNIAWLVADTSIYRVDLKTGKASMTGRLSGLEDGTSVKVKLKDFSVIGRETKSAM